MKNIFISMPIAAILVAGCFGNQTKEQEQSKDVHVHDDGSIHQNHKEDTTVRQEEFTVPADTSMSKTEYEKEQSHDGHEHPHTH